MTPDPRPQTSNPRPVVVYDGECRFCQWSVRRVAALDWHRRFDLVPRQAPGVNERFPALADSDFSTGLRLLCPDGAVHVGADAVYHIYRRLPPLHLLAWLYRVPVLHALFRAAYAVIARYRFRLFGRANCDDGLCTVSYGERRGGAAGPSPRHGRKPMSATLGSGEWTYEELPEWEKLPPGWSFFEVPDVAVDARDRVYVCTRGEHPVVVLEADGTFVTAFGEGQFVRAHGITVGPDGNLYCADDSGHCIRTYSPDGEPLATMGSPNRPAPRFSGRPFHQPTKVAFDPATGACYVADGYGNARVHKYAADGEHLLSWGEYGTDPGQFNLVHSICTDSSGKVYVADRENHRVQIFDGEGTYLGQWNDVHRPCGLHIAGDVGYVGQLPSHLSVNADYPNIGACVTIHALDGRRLARLGDVRVGLEPGQFTSPHGVAVDSRGDLYVAEVSWTAYGSHLDPPGAAPCFRKLVRKPA